MEPSNSHFGNTNPPQTLDYYSNNVHFILTNDVNPSLATDPLSNVTIDQNGLTYLSQVPLQLVADSNPTTGTLLLETPPSVSLQQPLALDSYQIEVLPSGHFVLTPRAVESHESSQQVQTITAVTSIDVSNTVQPKYMATQQVVNQGSSQPAIPTIQDSRQKPREDSKSTQIQSKNPCNTQVIKQETAHHNEHKKSVSGNSDTVLSGQNQDDLTARKPTVNHSNHDRKQTVNRNQNQLKLSDIEQPKKLEKSKSRGKTVIRDHSESKEFNVIDQTKVNKKQDFESDFKSASKYLTPSEALQKQAVLDGNVKKESDKKYSGKSDSSLFNLQGVSSLQDAIERASQKNKSSCRLTDTQSDSNEPKVQLPDELRLALSIEPRVHSSDEHRVQLSNQSICELLNESRRSTDIQEGLSSTDESSKVDHTTQSTLSKVEFSNRTLLSKKFRILSGENRSRIAQEPAVHIPNVQIPKLCDEKIELSSETKIEILNDSEVPLSTESIVYLEAQQSNAPDCEIKVENDANETTKCMLQYDLSLPTDSNQAKPARKSRTISENLPQLDEDLILPPSKDKYRYKCDRCPRAFHLSYQLKRHVYHHLSHDKKLKCSVCSETFNHKVNHLIHEHLHSLDRLSSLQSTMDRHSCPVCGTTFSRLAGLKSHLMTHLQDDDVICVKCSEEFSTEYSLELHYLEHEACEATAVAMATGTPNAEPVEGIEPGTSSCEAARKSAMRRAGRLTCKVCKKVLSCEEELEKHVNYHKKVKYLTRGRKYRKGLALKSRSRGKHCHVCNKCFGRPSQLIRHLRIHTGERPFKCEQCSKSFNQKNALDTHMMKHTGARPHKCHICHATFAQPGNLKIHLQRLHTVPWSEDQVLFSCPHCPSIFSKQGLYTAHVARRHRPKQEPRSEPLREKNADYSNTQPVYKPGPAPSPLTCNHCHKPFKSRSDLIRHFRSHTKEKPFKCTDCDKTFSTRANLTTHHNSIHARTKVYTCNLCTEPRHFNYFSTLRKHQRTIHEDVPILCKHCNLQCSTFFQLRKHLSIHHPKIIPDPVPTSSASYNTSGYTPTDHTPTSKFNSNTTSFNSTNTSNTCLNTTNINLNTANITNTCLNTANLTNTCLNTANTTFTNFTPNNNAHLTNSNTRFITNTNLNSAYIATNTNLIANAGYVTNSSSTNDLSNLVVNQNPNNYIAINTNYTATRDNLSTGFLTTGRDNISTGFLATGLTNTNFIAVAGNRSNYATLGSSVCASSLGNFDVASANYLNQILAAINGDGILINEDMMGLGGAEGENIILVVQPDEYGDPGSQSQTGTQSTTAENNNGQFLISSELLDPQYAQTIGDPSSLGRMVWKHQESSELPKMHEGTDPKNLEVLDNPPPLVSIQPSLSKRQSSDPPERSSVIHKTKKRKANRQPTGETIQVPDGTKGEPENSPNTGHVPEQTVENTLGKHEKVDGKTAQENTSNDQQKIVETKVTSINSVQLIDLVADQSGAEFSVQDTGGHEKILLRNEQGDIIGVFHDTNSLREVLDNLWDSSDQPGTSDSLVMKISSSQDGSSSLVPCKVSDMSAKTREILDAGNVSKTSSSDTIFSLKIPSVSSVPSEGGGALPPSTQVIRTVLNDGTIVTPAHPVVSTPAIPFSSQDSDTQLFTLGQSKVISQSTVKQSSGLVATQSSRTHEASSQSIVTARLVPRSSDPPSSCSDLPDSGSIVATTVEITRAEKPMNKSAEMEKPASQSSFPAVQYYGCPFSSCDRILSSEFDLNTHYLTHGTTTTVVYYKCKSCDQYLDSEQEAKLHALSHEKYACATCTRVFSNEAQRKIHFMREHCDEFDKMRKQENSAAPALVNTSECGNTEHPSAAPLDTPPPLLSCVTCGAQFSSPPLLQQHIRASHTQPEPPRVKRKPVDRRAKVENVRELTGEEVTQLLARDDRPRSLSEKVLLDVTKEKLNPPLPPPCIAPTAPSVPTPLPSHPNRCALCPKSFKKPIDLVRHRRVHTKEKPYACAECGSRFSLKSSLVAHENTHSRARHFECHVCERDFACASSLKVHMRLHAGSRPFICPVVDCGKTFTNSGHCNSHVLTHDKYELPAELRMNVDTDSDPRKKLFKRGVCPVCKKAVSDFSRHLHCKGCSKLFLSEAALQTHRDRVHGIEPSPRDRRKHLKHDMLEESTIASALKLPGKKIVPRVIGSVPASELIRSVPPSELIREQNVHTTTSVQMSGQMFNIVTSSRGGMNSSDFLADLDLQASLEKWG